MANYSISKKINITLSDKDITRLENGSVLSTHFHDPYGYSSGSITFGILNCKGKDYLVYYDDECDTYATEYNGDKEAITKFLNKIFNEFVEVDNFEYFDIEDYEGDDLDYYNFKEEVMYHQGIEENENELETYLKAILI